MYKNNEQFEKENKLGLVLSGGGARGAYEAGVSLYMAEIGLEPDMYSGASVGALNATFLASASSIQTGAHKLRMIWENISNEKELKINAKMLGVGFLYTSLDIASQHNSAANRIKKSFLDHLQKFEEEHRYTQMLVNSPLEGLAKPTKSLLNTDGLRSLIEYSINMDELDRAKPIWISMYPSFGLIDDLASLIMAELGFSETRSSDYIHLQSLEVEERVTALLASAALPLAYDSQIINGKKYIDGGLGEWRNSHGNTPLKPLVDAGCSYAIVAHLSDGSMWNRHHFPNTTIIEIRPKHSLHPNGKIKSLMDFNHERISTLIEQGYEDAKRCIGEVKNALELNYKWHQSRYLLKKSIEDLENDDFNEAIKMLDNY
ncbi:NTE family protein [Natronincola peptidivorans]|uniref:NTE family protein n=1 Tax=Natronincola peptidivorans TaxID=426128 RepID=A0A1I0EJZ9_9FIRM|nr:patatin-like phospholipase family protein [Natronincola peptidivorans]SET45688.1 NTE family protein [Natronincola peptidivorans]